MSQLGKKILFCLGFILCTIWYAKANFYRDPGSAFFDVARAYEQKYSTYRSEQVEGYIDSLDRSDTHLRDGNSNGNASVCIAISSVSRGGSHQYLETTVASILQSLTTIERDDLLLKILIAETDPTNHPSWTRDWIHRAADDVFTYDVSPGEAAYIRSLEEKHDIAKKGVYDYIYSLQRCYETGTPYIGVFEDDIMLAEGWFMRLLDGLQDIEKQSSEASVKATDHDSRTSDSWLFVRLFNQERSTGWAHHHIGGNHEPLIILAIILIVAVPATIARSKWRFARANLDMETVWVLLLVLNPAMVILFYQSGKASTLPPSPGVFAQPFGCCSQAMVYPRSQVPPLIKYLQKKQGQVDLLLNQRAREQSLTRYNLYPVQAQHIGIQSARTTTEEEAQAIWSMAYEDLDPAQLQLEHQRMVEDYYATPLHQVQ